MVGCVSMNIKDKKDQDFIVPGVKNHRLFEAQFAEFLWFRPG
jgi:hypothetical protein